MTYDGVTRSRWWCDDDDARGDEDGIVVTALVGGSATVTDRGDRAPAPAAGGNEVKNVGPVDGTGVGVDADDDDDDEMVDVSAVAAAVEVEVDGIVRWDNANNGTIGRVLAAATGGVMVADVIDDVDAGAGVTG